MAKDLTIPDADLIVRAVNSYAVMRDALAAHDAYMLDAGYCCGPESDALHPKAAANWRRIRAALALADGQPVSQ